ncbi:MAG: hypoxanthine phosphoribosyltransferase [Ruminococcaceae bacterium]|nr:hypoxanthine phosphoribosyltransferase [Oscillospiraceae bacterium]
MRNDIEKVLISSEEISKRIEEIGKQISRDYEGKDLLMVSVLKGSFIFMSDLVRSVDIPLEVDFMMVSSYVGQVSSGAVKIVKDLDIPLENKDILIVEDILDSGRTLEYISSVLRVRNPNSIKICTLLDKPSRRIANIKADYIGFEVPDEFVVGYGLDFNEKYRNLKYIGLLKPEIYN